MVYGGKDAFPPPRNGAITIAFLYKKLNLIPIAYYT